ncbi:hypothetical protein HMF3257_03900 [Spirosoma telluris]|uniref:Uncharacterized protein n=1 Tax=Spirosoma telluris TaxID=2183553 RepID=A0A327NMC5_9BACT|nr:hypothetical protein HMF3257_03900 [Spirosoma telluris]
MFIGLAMSFEAGNDILLWRRFQVGDSGAFDQLVTQHYGLMYNNAIKFSKDRAFVAMIDESAINMVQPDRGQRE